MDLRQLEIFCKIYECGSVSKAGAALCLTQPTVSSHLKNLEETLQTRLFDRLGREIVPTRAGEHLYRYARDIVKLKEEARLTLEQLGGRLAGTLEIGASSIPGEYLLPSLIGRFRQKHGGVTFRMRIGDSHDVVNMVAERAVELGVIGAQTNNSNIESRELGCDELVLVAGPEFGPSRVSADEFKSLPLILRERGSGTRASFETNAEMAGISVGKLNIVAEIGSTEAVKGAVRAGLGLSILSNLAVADELANGTLKRVEAAGLPISRKFYVISHRLREKGLLCQSFIDFLFA